MNTIKNLKTLLTESYQLESELLELIDQCFKEIFTDKFIIAQNSFEEDLYSGRHFNGCLQNLDYHKQIAHRSDQMKSMQKSVEKRSHRTKAFLKRELIEDETYACASITITREEWESLGFLCMQLDSEDPTPFLETDNPDGFNLILLHPKTHQLFWANSCDFDFAPHKS